MQSSSVSPRGYGSNGSTPHSSNGSSYNGTMNGYTSSASLGNMGMPPSTNDYLPGTAASEQIIPTIKSEIFWFVSLCLFTFLVLIFSQCILKDFFSYFQFLTSAAAHFRELLCVQIVYTSVILLPLKSLYYSSKLHSQSGFTRFVGVWWRWCGGSDCLGLLDWWLPFPRMHLSPSC